MINLENVSYRYHRSQRHALNNVTASIAPGIHLLLGDNGAGKTTLLHIMAGLRFPTAGSCTIDGTPTSKRHPELLADTFLFDDEMEFPETTINSLKKVHSVFYPGFSADMLADNLAVFEMDGNEKLREMSLGSRKKAFLAYALSLNTKVLLLDEPTNGLDIAARKTLRRLLSQCIGIDQTVIVSTHTIGDLEVLYDGVTVLRHGNLVLSMTTEDILGKLNFTTSTVPPSAPLYTEREMGVIHSIVENHTGEPATSINFSLLYMALQAPEGINILNILKNNRQI